MPVESSSALRPDTGIISPSRRDEPLGQARVIARPAQPTNIPVIGTVTDQTTGRPLSGVPVKLSDSKGKVVASGVSDAAGQVRVVVAAADVDASDEFTAQLDGGSETGVSQSADGTMRFAASTLQKRNGSTPYRVAEAKPPAQYAPSLAQIQVSPKDHVVVPGTEDGCDIPMPGTQAPIAFEMYQLVRRIEPEAPGHKPPLVTPINVAMPRPTPAKVIFGDRVVFRQEWRLLGQSLGDLIYSLPLAPLESTNIAIVEWSREDQAQRSEQTVASESLIHSEFHDRSVGETVSAAVSEYQGGFSVIGGVGAATPPAVEAVGAGTSHTWGNRNLVGDSTQQLADAVHQASQLVRSQTSTVVIQASQREEDSLQTRTVSNYNQNHALTIQYYEVLRHFVVTTTFDRMEPVVFIPFQPLRFDRETALRYRRILEANALDSRLPSWLDASERLGYSGNYPPSPASGQSPDGSPSQAAPAPTIARLQVQLTTGDQETRGPVTVELGLRDGTWAKAAEISGRAFGVETILEKNSTSTSDIAPDGTSDPDYALGAKVADVEQVRVTWTQNGIGDGWKFKGIKILYAVNSTSGLEATPLYLADAPDALRHFVDSGTKSWTSDLFTAPTPAGAPAPAPQNNNPVRAVLSAIGIGRPNLSIPGFNRGIIPMPLLSGMDLQSRSKDLTLEGLLLDHLNGARMHYSRAIWLSMDPDERTVVLDTESWLTASGLLSDIDPEPLGVSGNYVAFAYFGDKAPARPDDINIDLQPEQRHINLPTRGVFAEAHLSHCPAREQRDPTRMYGPDEIILPKAPDITGVQPGSRNVTPDLTPTPLPAPVVSIQNPPAAPDPAGLAAAFSLLGQMGPFRDMSTATEVGSLVGGLASGAISGNAVQPAAQRIAQALSSGGGAGGGGAFSSNHPAVSGTARDISDRLNLLQGTDLPEDTKAAIAQNLLDPGPANQTIDAGFIGSTEEVASHLSDWIAALLDPSDPKPQMHVEDTPLRRMTKKFSADLGGGNIAPDLGELVKVQRHRIEFNAPGKTLDDIETALADFANLVQYTQLSCNRLAGSGKIALGDRFRFRVFAGEWANAAATAIQASNLGSSRIVQFATSVLQIANSVGRRFDVEIIAYTKGGDFLQFAVQTLNTHPYAGRRSWIIRDLGGNKFRGETAEFNGWAWLVDGKVEASLGQNHLTDFSGLTWENFWPKLVNVLGGAITNQSGLIFPPKVIAPFANLQSSPLVQEILAEHPALQEEANRFTV